MYIIISKYKWEGLERLINLPKDTQLAYAIVGIWTCIFQIIKTKQSSQGLKNKWINVTGWYNVLGMCWSLVKFFSTCLAVPSPGRAMLIPTQGSYLCPTKFVTTLPRHSCYLSCYFQNFSLWHPSLYLDFLSLRLAGVFSSPPYWLCLLFISHIHWRHVFTMDLKSFVSRSPRRIAEPFTEDKI